MSSLEALLQASEIERETFTAFDAQRADLGGKELYRCTFRNVNFHEASWRRARLEECVFEDCDLTRMQVAQVSFLGVTFRRSKLLGVDFSEASSNPTFTFEACNLEYAAFQKVNLRKTHFIDCKLTESSFNECDLVDTDFSHSDLSGATIEQCLLTRANFTTAGGVFLDPTRNRVKDARIGVDGAAGVAMSFGMVVAGYGAPKKARSARR